MIPTSPDRSSSVEARSRKGRLPFQDGLRSTAAFTLTELVVVLLVIGILAVAAVARMDSMRVFGERTEYDTVRSALQFARKSAVAKRRYVCVQAAPGGLTLTVDANPPESISPPFSAACPFATALPLPQPDSSCAAVNVVCVRNTSLSPSAGTFQFDPLGRAAATVNVSVSGYAPITIEAETGLVY
jgi:MSHA pilin protein MshC